LRGWPALHSLRPLSALPLMAPVALLRNTGPSKKGGFGFIKATLSERQGYKGVAGEYEYLSDPIDFRKVGVAGGQQQ
jgi:hypothetical protein